MHRFRPPRRDGGSAPPSSAVAALFLLLLSPLACEAQFKNDFSLYPKASQACLDQAAVGCNGATVADMNKCLCGGSGSGGFALLSAACVGRESPGDAQAVYTIMSTACADSKTPLAVTKEQFLAVVAAQPQQGAQSSPGQATSSAVPTTTESGRVTAATSAPTPTTITTVINGQTTTITTAATSAAVTSGGGSGGGGGGGNSDASGGDGGMSSTAKTGIIAGASVAGAAILAIAVVFILRHRRRRAPAEESHPMLPAGAIGSTTELAPGSHPGPGPGLSSLSGGTHPDPRAQHSSTTPLSAKSGWSATASPGQHEWKSPGAGEADPKWMIASPNSQQYHAGGAAAGQPLVSPQFAAHQGWVFDPTTGSYHIVQQHQQLLPQQQQPPQFSAQLQTHASPPQQATMFEAPGTEPYRPVEMPATPAVVPDWVRQHQTPQNFMETPHQRWPDPHASADTDQLRPQQQQQQRELPIVSERHPQELAVASNQPQQYPPGGQWGSTTYNYGGGGSGR